MRILQSLAAALLSTAALVSLASAQQPSSRSLGACDRTTIAAASACGFEAAGDYNLLLGVCENIASADAKQKCRDRAGRNHTRDRELCIAQAGGRQSVCDTLGQAPYDPAINPANFSTNITNRLFPLKPGNVWVYRSGSSEVTVTVTSETFRVAGVTCVVVHDVNRVDGEIEEDTLDYYAQHSDGSVWYFGEDTISYDNGIASTEGSWRAGRDGAKPGIVMFAQAPLGKTSRLEFRLGEAEDLAKIIARNKHVEVPFGTFENALQTRETTPIEPDLLESKYYVPGIGNVLAVNVITGEREELVNFTPGP